MNAMKTMRKPAQIWVVEDDRIYRDVLCEGLEQAMPGVTIRKFPNESQVYAAVEELESKENEKPDMIIADVMMPYKFPGENTPDPSEEIKKEGEDAFRTAGIRLWQRVRDSEDSQLQKIPWIYHTVLRPKTMKFEENKDENTFYIGKDQPFADLANISDVIFQQLDSRWDGSDEEETVYLSRSPKMRKRLLGAMALPIQQCFPVLE
jgi:CheY-like chemotaxis protein